jgi:hypothetical protein
MPIIFCRGDSFADAMLFGFMPSERWQREKEDPLPKLFPGEVEQYPLPGQNRRVTPRVHVNLPS